MTSKEARKRCAAVGWIFTGAINGWPLWEVEAKRGVDVLRLNAYTRDEALSRIVLAVEAIAATEARP